MVILLYPATPNVCTVPRTSCVATVSDSDASTSGSLTVEATPRIVEQRFSSLALVTGAAPSHPNDTVSRLHLADTNASCPQPQNQDRAGASDDHANDRDVLPSHRLECLQTYVVAHRHFHRCERRAPRRAQRVLNQLPPHGLHADDYRRVETCDSEQGGRRRNRCEAFPPHHHLTVNVTAFPSIRLVGSRNIIEAPERNFVPTMAQRDSEPQLIATTLDELTSDVTRKLGEDGLLDEIDMQIIRGLKVLTFRQSRQAEVFDLTTSINRVGFTPRNIRRLRDMEPDLFAPDCA